MFIALFAICRRGLIYDVSLPLWRLKGEPIYRQTERRAPKKTHINVYIIFVYFAYFINLRARPRITAMTYICTSMYYISICGIPNY